MVYEIIGNSAYGTYEIETVKSSASSLTDDDTARICFTSPNDPSGWASNEIHNEITPSMARRIAYTLLSAAEEVDELNS